MSWLPLTSPAFDKDRKPYAFDPDKAKKLLEEAGYKDGFEFEWTTSQNESWGLPIVEAVDPDAGQGRHQGEGQADRDVSVLVDTIRKGDFQAYICLVADRPRPAGGAEVLPLRAAAWPPATTSPR